MQDNMASLYKNNNTWYLIISHNGIWKSRSLNIKSYKVAKSIKPHAKSTFLGITPVPIDHIGS